MWPDKGNSPAFEMNAHQNLPNAANKNTMTNRTNKNVTVPRATSMMIDCLSIVLLLLLVGLSGREYVSGLL
jgi:hypothetical protein